jgi:hypothetical protein
MRKPMWAVQLGNKNILNYEYSDCDLKVALFRTREERRHGSMTTHFGALDPPRWLRW